MLANYCAIGSFPAYSVPMYLKQYHISRQISQNHGRDHSEYADPAVEREIIFLRVCSEKKCTFIAHLAFLYNLLNYFYL